MPVRIRGLTPHGSPDAIEEFALIFLPTIAFARWRPMSASASSGRASWVLMSNLIPEGSHFAIIRMNRNHSIINTVN